MLLLTLSLIFLLVFFISKCWNILDHRIFKQIFYIFRILGKPKITVYLLDLFQHMAEKSHIFNVSFKSAKSM